MLRAVSVVRRPAVKTDKVVDRLLLDHEARHRRRIALTGEGGLAFLLDLDRATVIDDGDAVRLEDGRLVQVTAAPERLVEVRTDNPLRLMRVAWHLGNRHVATELTADAVYFAHDHVLLDMVRRLGVSAAEVTRPFRPERGAYAGEGGHDHAHDDACGCGHDHGHAHAGHDHGHAKHEHGHDHGGHDHGHHHPGHDHAHGAGHDHHHHAHD